MVYRRKDRPQEGYRVWPTLPAPWGRVGPWQTGMFSKRQAEQVERWLIEEALTRPELIEALQAKRFTLRDAWVAKLRGQLDAILLGFSDPLLSDAIAAYRPRCTDLRTKAALKKIEGYAPEGVRLSWLAGGNIRSCFEKDADAGLRPNSIRRGLHRAISELLVYHLGQDGRAAAYKDVEVPGEDDTREVHVTPEEVRKILDACAEDFRWLVVAAIATSIDRKPLLQLRVRHLNEADSMVAVPDRKTKDRPRLLKLSAIALLAFRVAARGKEAGELLWPFKARTVRTLWEAAREAAGRKDLHFKDLRHLLPTMLAEMKVDRREIQAYLGHAPGSTQTDRYITPAGDPAILEAAAERLGLTRSTLRAG
jgi:integrase